MHIIKLNATESTNSYLRQLYSEIDLGNFTVVTTENQLKGRGQMGAVWESQKYKNLTFSTFIKGLNIKVEHKFYLSIVTSLAILEALKPLNLKQLHIKWPNDILAEGQKIGGILIENMLKKQIIESSIIGIGINVNQLNFEGLPKASSLKKITGIHYELDVLLSSILKEMENVFLKLDTRDFSLLKSKYELSLFRLNKPSTFEDTINKRFTAYIQGISNQGKLLLLMEDNILKAFDFKEVKLLY
mgnify:CR=1 FL=1